MDARLQAWQQANAKRAADYLEQQRASDLGSSNSVNQVEGQFYDPQTKGFLNYLKNDPVYPTTGDMQSLGSPMPHPDSWQNALAILQRIASTGQRR